jgi:hypothetical protein
MEKYNDVQKKFLTLASNIGFLNASKVVGGVNELLNILGEDFLTKNNKILIIKEIILTTDDNQLTMLDMNENPILLKDEDGEITQIEMVFPDDIMATVYGGYKYTQELGEEYMYYDELPNQVLNNIFNGVVSYYLYKLEIE